MTSTWEASCLCSCARDCRVPGGLPELRGEEKTPHRHLPEDPDQRSQAPPPTYQPLPSTSPPFPSGTSALMGPRGVVPLTD